MNQQNSESGNSKAEQKVYPFLNYKWHFMAVSVFFFVASLYLLFTKGLNYGVDFLGGIKLVYQFSGDLNEGNIRGQIEGLGLGDVQVVSFGESSKRQFLIKTKAIDGRNVTDEITSKLKTLDAQAELVSEENVGPKVGAELRKRGVFAVVLTWVLILVYVGIRFDFLFAPGAIVALIHDIVIPIGFFALLGKEFNLPILAALLTITGYSVNDTIVIYDRVRENLKKLPASIPLTQVINQSLTETLSRTIVTSLTVFFVLLVVFLIGGPVLHDFAFCMLLGIVFGSYSTIFIASPVYLGLQKIFPHHGLQRHSKKK